MCGHGIFSFDDIVPEIIREFEVSRDNLELVEFLLSSIDDLEGLSLRDIVPVISFILRVFLEVKSLAEKNKISKHALAYCIIKLFNDAYELSLHVINEIFCYAFPNLRSLYRKYPALKYKYNKLRNEYNRVCGEIKEGKYASAFQLEKLFIDLGVLGKENRSLLSRDYRKLRNVVAHSRFVYDEENDTIRGVSRESGEKFSLEEYREAFAKIFIFMVNLAAKMLSIDNMLRIHD